MKSDQKTAHLRKKKNNKDKMNTPAKISATLLHSLTVLLTVWTVTPYGVIYN